MAERRDPCRSCQRLTKRKSGLCLECDPALPAPGQRKADPLRPERPCTGCGKRTTAKSGQCLACEPTWAKQGRIGYEHAVWADTGPGQWVNVRGTQRWVPSTGVG